MTAYESDYVEYIPKKITGYEPLNTALLEIGDNNLNHWPYIRKPCNITIDFDKEDNCICGHWCYDKNKSYIKHITKNIICGVGSKCQKQFPKNHFRLKCKICNSAINKSKKEPLKVAHKICIKKQKQEEEYERQNNMCLDCCYQLKNNSYDRCFKCNRTHKYNKCSLCNKWNILKKYSFKYCFNCKDKSKP
jgi:hypothetical protein